MKINIKQKGSATVEAALIFPLIMFIMFGIIYLTIVHYQNNVMIAESIRAMNRAGAYYQYIDMDIKGQAISDDKTPTAFDDSIPQDGIINIEMIKYRHVYRTLIDVLSEGVSKIFKFPFGTKKKQAHTYVNARVSNVAFKQYQNDKKADKIGDITGQGFMFFGPDLKVDISRSYINPLKNISKVFLGSNNVTDRATEKKITVSSVISNQAEFIRNIDTVYNIGSSIYELIKPK